MNVELSEHSICGIFLLDQDVKDLQEKKSDYKMNIILFIIE